MQTAIFVDGTPFKEASPEDKLHVYILITFSNSITKKLSQSISQILLDASDKDGLLNIDELK